MAFNLDQNELSLILSELPGTQLVQIVGNQTLLIEKLQNKINSLEKRIVELQQSPPSSTAPFRRKPEELSRTPQKSGQKKGHPGFFRQSPTPTEIIDVPLEYCSHCFSHLEHLAHHTQTIEEIPPIEVQVIQINTQSGFCPKCQKRVRSSHPLQISKAVGAASTALGPRAIALAVELQSRFHLSKQKTCATRARVFRHSFNGWRLG